VDRQFTTLYVITRGVVIMPDPTILILASLADDDKHGYATMEISRFSRDFGSARARCMVRSAVLKNAVGFEPLNRSPAGSRIASPPRAASN